MPHIPDLFYYSVLNFSVFSIALYYAMRRPMRDYFAKRAVLLAERVQAATQAEAAARVRLDEIRNRMLKLESDVTAMRRQAEADAELERVAIVQRAESFSQKIALDTEKMLAQELGKAEETVKRTAVDMAILMAERILREQMTPEDQGRVALRFIERVGTKH